VSPRALAAWFIVLLLVGFLVNEAHSQDAGRDPAPHKRYHQYYQEWKQPGSETSCCNAREYGTTPSGDVVPRSGDCEPTQAYVALGADGLPHWWARLPLYWRAQGYGGENGGFIEIPDSRIIHEGNPSTEEFHLCWTPQAGVMCGVPPDTGG
jgi:hypothetical protein